MSFQAIPPLNFESTVLVYKFLQVHRWRRILAEDELLTSISAICDLDDRR